MKYIITIHGYSSDSAFYHLTKEAKEFWDAIIDTDEESLLTDYLWGDIDEDKIPSYAMFLNGDGEFDADSFIGENSTIDLNSAYIIISDENGVQITDLPFVNPDIEDYNFPISWIPQEEAPDGNILHVDNMMKGMVFAGEFEDNEFDVSKLRFKMQENFVGESMISNVFYGKDEIYNTGSDERGKGRAYNIL